MKYGLRRCDIRLTSTGNADDAVAEPLLKDPLIFPLTMGYEGAYIILFSEKCSQKHRNHENNSSERIIFCTFPVCLPCWSP